jgi:hypothetical protein
MRVANGFGPVVWLAAQSIPIQELIVPEIRSIQLLLLIDTSFNILQPR